ncbi:hypothetical protein B0J15DRAFT_169306 [Fusarium solani]|uniref:Uncharacterized protein n=1 Tax=Fusarium solani TaxID=169388 RepID=A0A9P9RB95_FUSSL|nr:uncharacterized protein B0J15DRAFT_169306 [Fusarium solani]KAH7272183.1 hypothetical protein B0J15DRAFT_169306 [Fusarium solani]
MVRFNFRTWANHDRRPRTAPPSGTQYSTLDGWGNGKSCVAPLLCRADASFAGARGLAQRAILGHGIHVTLYRSHRLLSVPLYCLSLYVSVRAHQLCTGFPGLLALCQPPLKKTGLCAGPRLPRISPSRRGGIFLPVGRLARNKCPRVSGYAVSSRRCVGSSVFVCLFACLLAWLRGRASPRTKGPRRDSRSAASDSAWSASHHRAAPILRRAVTNKSSAWEGRCKPPTAGQRDGPFG